MAPGFIRKLLDVAVRKALPVSDVRSKPLDTTKGPMAKPMILDKRLRTAAELSRMSQYKLNVQKPSQMHPII
jgi:hypothetical protein